MSEAEERRRRGAGRYAVVAAALLLAVGVVVAVGDVFRTSRPATVSGGAEVRLNLRDFNFTPHAVVVEGGRTVTIELLGESVHAHTFTSPELGVDVAVEPGESRSVTVEASAPGQYGFYCRFHQSSNMRGFVQFRG